MKKYLLYFIIICMIPRIGFSRDFEEIREKINRLTAEIQELKKQRKPKILRNALFTLGELYFEDQLFRKAAESWEEVRAFKPDKKMLKRLYPLLGESYEKLKEYNKAIPYYQEALKLSSKDADVHLSLARTFTQVELFDNALEHYQKVLSLKEADAEAYEGLGTVHQIRGFFDKAVDAYEKSLAVKSPNDSIYLQLSAIYERRGQLDLAIEMQESAIKVVPSAERYIRLGFLNTLKMNYEDALTHFSHAKELDPTNQDIYLHIGVTAFKQDLFKAALEAFDKAISVNNRNALAYFFRARTEYRVGNIKQALKDAKNAHTYAQSQMLSQYAMKLIDTLGDVADRVDRRE